MIILLALCTFVLSLSNLWLWIKVYKIDVVLVEVCKILLEIHKKGQI